MSAGVASPSSDAGLSGSADFSASAGGESSDGGVVLSYEDLGDPFFNGDPAPAGSAHGCFSPEIYDYL